MRSVRGRVLVGVVATVALAGGGVAAGLAAGSAPAAGMPTIAGHRCTQVTYRAHVKLRGTSGNDVLCGLGGHDTLIGGRGNDWLIGRGAGNTASYRDHATTLVASLATHLETDPSIHETDHLLGISNLIAGTGNDVLIGNNGNNTLVAGPGNQTLDGKSGNDNLIGGTGRDLLIGGPGRDHISAGAGNDTIDASEGQDNVDCGTGADTVSTDSQDHEAEDCQGDQHETLQQYQGTIAAVDTNANTIGVNWVEVNDNAQTWLNANGDPNPVTISLTGADIHTGHDGNGGSQGDTQAIPADGSGGSGSVSDLHVGDRVEVEATTDTAGTGLVAVSVHTEGQGNEQHVQEYRGTVAAVDTTANTVSVQWTEVNDAAQAWLDAHGDPNPVTISLNGANIEQQDGQAMQPGDDIEVAAVPDSSGNGLVAVDVHTETGGG